MCTNRIYDWETGYSYSCRKCDQCRLTAVNDMKLRLLAEHRIAQLRGWPGFFTTLTYGSDDRYFGEHRINPRALSLYWDDVREWRQRLWNAGIPHRAYIVGEVGDQKGRVHWHLVVWFTGFEEDVRPHPHFIGPTRRRKIPPNVIMSHPGDIHRYVHWLRVPERDRLDPEFIGPMRCLDVFAKVQRHWQDTEGGLPLWSHGWSTWEPVTDDAIGYTCAYLMKNGRVEDTGIDGKGYQGRKYYGGTTRPPLGSDWFCEVLAPAYVEQGVPMSCIVKFPEVRQWRKKGMVGEPPPYEFFLAPGATRRNFFDAYVTLWRAKFKRENAHRRPEGGFKRSETDNWPQSDLLDAHVDDMDRRKRRKGEGFESTGRFGPGVPDIDDEAFNREFYARRLDKPYNGGLWAKLNALSPEDRERLEVVRKLQAAGFSIDFMEELRKLPDLRAKKAPEKKKVDQNEFGSGAVVGARPKTIWNDADWKSEFPDEMPFTERLRILSSRKKD